MQFEVVERVFPDQPMWGARSGPMTFIITRDDGRFSASVKLATAVPFDQTRVDIGGGYQAFATLAEAQDACRAFVKQWKHN